MSLNDLHKGMRCPGQVALLETVLVSGSYSDSCRLELSGSDRLSWLWIGQRTSNTHPILEVPSFVGYICLTGSDERNRMESRHSRRLIEILAS